MSLVKFGVDYKLIFTPSHELNNILRILNRNGFRCRRVYREGVRKIICYAKESNLDRIEFTLLTE